MPDIEETKEWVGLLHAGQVDKTGAPYITHVMGVYERLCRLFPEAGIDVRLAALLHDTVEDCDISPDDLRARGYSENTIAIVEAVTIDPSDGFTYQQRMENLAATGPLAAVQVKVCDLMDNSDPVRLAKLPPERAQSLAKHYQRALEVMRKRLSRG